MNVVRVSEQDGSKNNMATLYNLRDRLVLKKYITVQKAIG
jgi:hypothetical protein